MSRQILARQTAAIDGDHRIVRLRRRGEHREELHLDYMQFDLGFRRGSRCVRYAPHCRSDGYSRSNYVSYSSNHRS